MTLLNSEKKRQISEEEFWRRVKEKMNQLKRSNLFRKKIEAEIGSAKITKEQAEEYIKKTDELAIADIREKNNAKQKLYKRTKKRI